jgi:hypothetical protein
MAEAKRSLEVKESVRGPMLLIYRWLVYESLTGPQPTVFILLTLRFITANRDHKFELVASLMPIDVKCYAEDHHVSRPDRRN